MSRLKSELTAAQLGVYNFVLACLRTEHAPPTRAQISHHFGWKSANAAQDHLRALVRKGFVVLLARQHRGIRVHALREQERDLKPPDALPGPLASDPSDSTALASLRTPPGSS